jgi:hypothetical protein
MNHKILVAEAENTIKGFVVLGISDSSRGETTSRVIEWAGNPRSILAVLAEVFNYGINAIRLSVPFYELELNRLLHSIKRTAAPFPGTIKVTNLKLLLKQLGPFLNGKIEIKDVDENYKELIVNQKSVLIEVSALEKLILQGDHNLDTDLNDIFPIPLPFPEGLNYV